MAVDGSFRLEWEFSSFMDRCPKLKSVTGLSDLLEKVANGNETTEDEVVLAVFQLVLHPSYTIPLLGCFRPIAQKIVDRTVALLHLVSNLRRDDMEEFDEDGFLRDSEYVCCLIDVYDGKGKGLRLHELACLAFCRALDLIPFLLGSILNYFKLAPAPFQRIMQCESVSKALAMGAEHLLNVVRVSYRFLEAEPDVFTTMWDWSCFLDLVQQSANLDLVNHADSKEIISDVRWCSVGILSVVLKLSFEASANLGSSSEEALQSFLRWKEFCMDISLEKGGWHLEPSAEETHADNIANLKCHGLRECRGPGNPFVLTSAVTKSFEMVSLAVSQRSPVLLYGPAGAGKTALIHKLAQIHGRRVLSIHMDEQIDAKTLVGSYVSANRPGQFRWQPGSLTQAVLNGSWVVFEDVDKAPMDILAILSPLLDGAATFSTGNGQVVRVNEAFRLFSCVTSSNSDISRPTEGRSSLAAVWQKVMIGPPSKDDLLHIVLAWYPELKALAIVRFKRPGGVAQDMPLVLCRDFDSFTQQLSSRIDWKQQLVDKLIETFERVNKPTRSQFGFTASSGHINRFTLRDLLKWCKRIASLDFCFDQDGLSSNACNSICKEAIDIFASFFTSAGNRLDIMRQIAELWPVSAAVDKPVIEKLHSGFRVGRVVLPCAEMTCHRNMKPKPFVELRSTVHALERVACSVKFNEPVLLVGETGTGKTTLVQTLASRLCHKLTVLNLSQQSDVADLFGGFKPLDARSDYIKLYHEFEKIFTDTFSSKANETFLSRSRKFLNDKNWKMLLSQFRQAVNTVIDLGKSSLGTKRKRPLSKALLESWEFFSLKLEEAYAQVSACDGMIFSFVEGPFINALKNGEWILLDEVNLAPPEILQRVIGVLEDENGSLCLSERGDIDNICRHPDFRIFACMNPATDAGKRDLPFALRSRFTEYYVDDVLDNEDLDLFIDQFKDVDLNETLINKIREFYKAAKESEERLQDGANQRPHFSLRSLYRALEYAKCAKKLGFKRSLYDGFCMFFHNLLDNSSSKIMNNLICNYLFDGKAPKQLPSYPNLISKADDIKQSYVLTESVTRHIDNLARAIFIGRYPVLLQGPTSSGKTSLVRFLAKKNGREFVRINNHEHTDLQEYLGSYITDASGKLVFQEGALVKAVRKGHWIVLDELNLAPSDVLEALNRLLDDNRELYVPELNETITAHPNFMLFATQNPPVVYGGRKILSRAFRNRFVEIHVEEIPQEELSIILEKRCEIPEKYAKKMVEVMKQLQRHRQTSKIFAGKHAFITPRDLFRWADRFRKLHGKGYEDLGRDGYYLIAERLRDDADKKIVKEVLERVLPIKLCESDMYGKEGRHSEDIENTGKIIWTKSMERMYFLVNRCYKMREPVLLVGETGGGKTTICQLLSIMLGSKLHVLNCHQYTETSDFLGGFYPVRERWQLAKDFQNLCDMVNQSKALKHFPGDKNILTDINQSSQILPMLSVIIKKYREDAVSHPEVTLNEVDCIEKLYSDLCQLQQKWRTIFTWQDGPLVESMKRGDLFLVDEISLADDSVLERLNSVLEPERELSLAEKGGSDLEIVSAHLDFFILATMNPGGDYGKKELSPALRNRFTEIWVPSVSNNDELRSIALGRISNPELTNVVNAMVDFWEFFNHLGTGRLLTVRDLLSWLSFINVTQSSLPAESAFVHGAFLVLLDGLSLGTNISKDDAADLRVKCVSFLLEKLKKYKQRSDSSSVDGLESYGWADSGSFPVHSYADNMECDNSFGIYPFYIEKGTGQIVATGFEFRAPTTRRNTLRVLRAMQLNKPVLLEGSPGVGKTSLIASLGRVSRHTVVRINLSEQTDIMDLLGSDLPVESDGGLQFAWSDGILLQALKNGSWVLLDELNLAPQSVLEGLNAILDHRAEVFIPELGRSFKCPQSFRVFACQNPSHQGGGRKGLPKSFLNRFTKVYVDELVDEDYLSICTLEFPAIERSLLLKLIVFNRRLHEETMLYHKFGEKGSPWEFNLRDVKRSCQIIQGAPDKSKSDCFLDTIYLQRMRTTADRVQAMKLYEQVFELKPLINPYPRVHLNPRSLIVGDISIERFRCKSSGKSSNNLKVLPGLRHCLEAVGQCLKHQWLCILVGPPSSGKTSLIRLLAELTGNVLHELNLSSTTDISELLGCFEQHNASRHYHTAIYRVERYINEYCSLQLESFPGAFSRRKNLITRWFAFLSNINNGVSATSIATYIDNPRMRDSIPQLVDIIECLKMDKDRHTLPLSWSDKDLESILKEVRKLERDYQKEHSVKFEWVAGLMIKAIENGEWIVLENANLCNPTVLDRINSLVEQSGSITINECGIVEGKPVVLLPHPNFRMFLTVNPSYGEMSRAMRNRGVEIYLMQPHWLLEGVSSKNLDEIELRDVKRFITLSGIPVGRLVGMMAKAHLFARHEGSHLDVTITYLELSRWVQLFQQLITSGNQPAWSIQISWEHAYLSTFGEGKGKEIVSQAAFLYLSKPELYQFTSSEYRLLCLPGGWPAPLKLRDYVCYSREACVRQNCMYLESLGSQIASFKNRGVKDFTIAGSAAIYLVDAVLLQKLIFPKTSHDTLEDCCAQNEREIDLAQVKLLFTADWVIEQATESDCWLYARWFEWFGFQLQSSIQFFNWFADLLKMCLSSTLTDEFMDMNPSVGLLSSCRTLLLNSSRCVGLLRKSFQQWSIETRHNYSFETQPFKPILISLRRIEEKVIDVLVMSTSFDVSFGSYSDLLEHHILFWESMISSQTERNLSKRKSQVERLLVFSRYLMKVVSKLKRVCPKEVGVFQIEIKNLDDIPSLCLSSRKSLLWKYGGHPILPSSAELYQKQCQLTNLCEIVWPRKNQFLKLDESELNKASLDAALSSNVELRLLAMQGVCMSSYIVAQADNTHIQQLEEMYQMLFGRLDFEKHKLEVKLDTAQDACCVFTPNILCRDSGFKFWLKTQPIIDETSLFIDLELLQHLTKITMLDNEEQHHALCNLSGPLQSSLKMSLTYSSRPPTDFLPHQKILWTMDVWSSVDRANEKVSSFILEMWFRWHATLWDACPVLQETLKEEMERDAHLKDERPGMLLPQKFFRPVKMSVIDQILKSKNFIRDYALNSLKLRATARNIWYSPANIIKSHERLLSTARSLFQQIIYAHKKSFGESKFAEIASAFHSIQEFGNLNVKVLVSLLASSNHHMLPPLTESYIEPLLSELYPVCSSDDVCLNIGCAFMRIGGLRYNLLICCDDLDPTVKYSTMYSELTKNIASLEIEIQVRKECAYLAGSTYLREADDCRITLLDELNAERIRLQKKMVFRSNPGKFNELRGVCYEFLELVTAVVEWIKNIESMQVEEVTEQVFNWQETTSCFIHRLSKDYSAYADIIEPVQIAIYEIKLGLSLIESSILYKNYLGNEKCNMDVVLGTVYLLMRFPRGCAQKTFKFDKEQLFKFGKQPKISTNNIDLPTNIEDVDMNFVQKIIGSTVGNISDGTASALSVKVDVYHNVLSRIRDSVADAHFLGDSTFKHLHEIFDGVASLWMEHRVKPEEGSEAHQFKFKTRAFDIESIIHIDAPDYENVLRNNSFSEWNENLGEDFSEKKKANQSDEASEYGWESQESKLDGIIDIHNQLFGSVDLIRRPGSIQVSDMDRLSSFLGSYMVGVQMTKGLKGSFSSNFDAKIAPEHLLRLCLEHEQHFIPSHRSAKAYNFYKDSNPPMMAQLLKPVLDFKQKILSLSKERDDHPALQKSLEVTDRILEQDHNTPLAKVLSDLEFLPRLVHESLPKFPLSAELKDIFKLVSSWHKLEFESWPALLEEVQSQYERNAGKLWLPLYAILRRSNAGDVKQYNKATIESLEEFFRTSSIGEFRKQLQLLLSFHGHIVNGFNRGTDISPSEWDSVKILYNTCGFYMQLLPQISEYIGANRKSIEKELQELMKLCRWDRVDNSFAIETFKANRLKLRKIVKKYTDLLQQPLMEFLGQEASRSGINTQSSHGSRLMADSFEIGKNFLDTICDQAQSKENQSSIWFAGSWKSLEDGGEIMDGMKDCIPSQYSCLLYRKERKKMWRKIKKICGYMTHCGNVWEDKGKKSIKRRALNDLIKLLERSGLSKHRAFVEDQFDKSESWLLQPSFELQHLLLTPHDLPSKNVNAGCDDLQSPSWETANKYYFKNIASSTFLEKTCLNKHKDFNLEEVNRSVSYVDHLIEIQQQQRALIYNFANQLKCLKCSMWPLSNLCPCEDNNERCIPSAGESSSDCSFVDNQFAVFECMWQQKQLVDAFCVMLQEEHLLLQTVGRNHLNTCPSVKQGAERIRVFIEKELPGFYYSKNRLDYHLLRSNEDFTLVEFALHPYGVTKKMKRLVDQNFDLIRTFKEKLSALQGQEDGEGEGGVKEILLGHFGDLIGKATTVAEEFASICQANLKRSDGNNNSCGEKLSGLKSGFDVALKGTYEDILGTFRRVGDGFGSTKEGLKNIKDWKILFERDIDNLQLDLICKSVNRIIQSAGELLNYCGDESSSIIVCEQLRSLHVLLEKLLDCGDNLLHDFLHIHSSVSAMTYVLANFFASLFTKGFGTTEEEEENSSKEKTQDATGTGMGEGAGLNDVSDQINDEDQLLGISDKANEEQDAKSDQPSKTEKGIEMEEDFTGDTVSVSEDSGDDESDDDQDEQLDKAMGEVGADSEKVDDKLGGMDDDDDENREENEKYEQGPSVSKASNDDELRPKDDSACANEDAEDLDAKESTEHNDENRNDEDGEGEDDMDVDNADTSLDPSGTNFEEQNEISENDTNMNKVEASEPMEDDESGDINDSDVKNDEVDDLMDEEGEETEHSVENGETDNAEESFPENDTEIDIRAPKNDDLQSTPNSVSDNVPSAQSAVQANEVSDKADLGELAPQEKYSDFSELKNDLAPTGDVPNAPQLEVRVSDSANGKIMSNERSTASLPPSDPLSRKPQPNPCRSVGDALKGWKERVKVSIDLQGETNNSDDLMDHDANEYAFTAEFKEDTNQALGPANADQTKEDISQIDTNRDVRNSEKDAAATEMEIDEQTFETGPVSSALNPVNDAKKQPDVSNLRKQPEESMEVEGDCSQDLSSLSGSLVSVNRSCISEEMHQLTFNGDKAGKAAGGFDLSMDTRNDAATLWRSYELLTTRLSQELAEQLRLVMEPTIASKLQGDYKTGKRINLKKVIQYIASQFRKDKIWLRRTRPNKRDYQVVIAVDDSRSMSEGRRGNFAIEALVTVCRAMSQLEVGNFAVTSFGQMGNVRLLHDFNQPLSPEAGIKMISSLTFKQENKVTDEPMGDLLKYLNDMLDTAVVHSRLPSGDNPLQQLVLIISDGRFSDKDQVKWRVSEILRKKCLVAFLILDDANESIMDAQEATLIQGKDVRLTKRIDSFPFPYYVVLKNIEALPRTLADLVRQWFELMQNSRE